MPKRKEIVKNRIMMRGGSQNAKILDWEDALPERLFFPEPPADVSTNPFDCLPRVAKYQKSLDIDEYNEMAAFYDFVSAEIP